MDMTRMRLFYIFGITVHKKHDNEDYYQNVLMYLLQKTSDLIPPSQLDNHSGIPTSSLYNCKGLNIWYCGITLFSGYSIDTYLMKLKIRY